MTTPAGGAGGGGAGGGGVGGGAKLFVLGASGAGKTPVARQIAERLGVAHVGASSWVRRVFPPHTPGTPLSDADRQAAIEAMTKFSVDELRRNPFACIAHLDEQLMQPCVVEGMRNPFDFVHAFDWRRDLVVFVERADNTLAQTAFERGLDVIRAYLEWLHGAGIIDLSRTLLARTYPDASAIEGVVDEALAFAAGRIQPTSPPLKVTPGDAPPSAPSPPKAPPVPSTHGAVDLVVSPARVHANIEPPLELFVNKELLFGGDARYAGEVVACRAFAFSSYPGSSPTFKLLLPDGAVFSYVAPSGLRWKDAPIAEPVLSLPELAYHACPDGDVVVTRFSALAGPSLSYFKARDAWLGARYVFTVDWYRGNDLLHCMLVDNGQLAFLPHHKIKFHGREPGFAPYKKLRNEWRLT